MNLFGIYFELWVVITLAVIASLIIVAALTLLVWGFVGYKRYPTSNHYKKYAFFIPARNEDNVIGDLIASIRAMDYPQDKITIFILANNCSANDKTAQIAKDMGEEVFELNDSNIKNVGMVLEKFFDYVKIRYGNFSEFDGYIRLDADNVVKKDFLNKLNDAFNVHPTVITAYRANKNFQDGIKPSLTCMLVTQCMMAFRLFSTWGVNPMITGPGVLIGAQVLEEMGGWHCKTISEDLEFSALLCKMEIRSYFCYEAVFYDEQASKMKYIFRQRLRWTKGTSEVFFKYWPTMITRIFSSMWKSAIFLVIGLLPMGVLSVVFTILFGIIAVVNASVGQTMDPVITWGIITLALNILPGWIVGIITFIVERKQTKDISFGKKALYVFFNPVGFFISNLADFSRLFIRVTWKPIPHGEQRSKL